MTDSPTINHARTTIRIAPWVCALAIAVAAIAAIWVRAPLNYLVWSAGFGVLWFGLVAVTWRVRHAAVRILTLLFFIFGHSVLRKRLLVDDTFFGSLQGILVSIASVSVLIIFLRRWLFKFARLEGQGG